MRSDMNKFETRSTKSETIRNVQNSNDQNLDPSDAEVLQSLSFGNSDLNLLVSKPGTRLKGGESELSEDSFDIRYSDFEATSFIQDR